MREDTDEQLTTILKRARARIADPKHWTRVVLARNAEGWEAPPWHPETVRWCAMGAVQAECCTLTPRARGRLHVALHSTVYQAALKRLAAATASGDPAAVNDRRGHAAVLAMFDEAIRRK